MPLPLIAAAASALGVSTSTVGGGILSAIGGGLSSLFGGKSKKKAAQQEQKYKLEQIRESEKLRGEEERKTSKYNIELNSAVDEYQRARKRGAFKNFGFATPTDPYANTAMQGYQQVWKPEDTKLVLQNAPGATTPAPTSLAAPVRR